MRSSSEFLVQEVLPLVAAQPERYGHEDSLTQDGSELSEAQLAQELPPSQRLMMVRYTNAAMQSLTLVDRTHTIDAFLPQSLLESLGKSKKIKMLSRVRGSIIGVTKYHYTTPARCLASDEFVTRRQSVTRASIVSGHALSPICLWIDAMDIVDDNELAVNPLPELMEHPDIAREVRACSEHELEKRLMLRQGLTSPAEASAIQPIDDQHPIVDEDCEITSDQEEALEAQEGWGPTQSQQPSDSQLIDENGSVPMMPESQEGESVTASQPLETSQFSAETESSSQDVHFQKENVRQAFVKCDESDSDEDQSRIESSPKTERKATALYTQESVKAEDSTLSKRTDLEGDAIQIPVFTSLSNQVVDLSHEDSEQPMDEPDITDFTGEEEDSEAFLPEEPCTQALGSPRIDASMSQRDPDLNASESQYMADGGMDDDWHTQPNDDSQLLYISSQAPDVDEVVVDDFAPQSPPSAIDQPSSTLPQETPAHENTADADAVAEPEQQPSRSPSPVKQSAVDFDSKRKRSATDTIRPAKVSRSTDERRVTFSEEADKDKQPPAKSHQSKASRVQDQPYMMRSEPPPPSALPAFLLAKDRVVTKMPRDFPPWRKPSASLGRMAHPSRRYADLYPPLDMERVKQMIAAKKSSRDKR